MGVPRVCHPKNRWISNSRLVEIYFWSKRHHVKPVEKILSLCLGTQIYCPLPDQLFLPHPFGIIIGGKVRLGNNVTLMQQVTLGGKDPWCDEADISSSFPILEEGVYVGAGAKILGPVKIGAWAVIGANAVVTKDVPAGSTVVGFNKQIGAP